jgi:membrane associated rhomboid family serine protease
VAPPSDNPFRARLPIVIVAAAVFVVLLVVTAVTESNDLGTAVAIYGIVGGILLGRLLAASERSRSQPSG